MNCLNCSKLIPEVGVVYGINPTALCRCPAPIPEQLPEPDKHDALANFHRVMKKIAIVPPPKEKEHE